MDLEVRPAVPDDAAGIAAVHVGSWQVAYRGLMPDEVLAGLSVTQREAFWREALADEHGGVEVYVAARDGAVVGFCAIGMPARDDDAGNRVAEVGAIYVEPQLWRQGIGTALMEAAVSRLRSNGWESVTLWVLAENHRAREFYARLGFKSDGAETTEERSGQKEVRLRVSLLA